MDGGLLMTEKGLLIVLSGPSGVGKGTVRQAIFSKGERDFIYSISATTRQRREGEVDGVDYFFKTREEFEDMIKNDQLLEYTEYVGNYYGTPVDYVQKTIDAGKDIFLEIEVQGAMQVKRRCPEAVLIFIMPPSFDVLKNRLIGRNTENEEAIAKRLNAAQKEISKAGDYDFVILNDEIEKAAVKLGTVIEAARFSGERIRWLVDEVSKSSNI